MSIKEVDIKEVKAFRRIMFDFLDIVRENPMVATFEDLQEYIHDIGKSKYDDLVKPFEDYFRDWLPLLQKYPEVATLLVTEDFYWKHYAYRLDGSLVDPKSSTFLMMLCYASVSIYSEKPITITHTTPRDKLPEILTSGKLSLSAFSDENECGQCIYSYAERSGLVADARGDAVIIVTVKVPWFRIVAYNDDIIKPLGEVVILEDVDLANCKIYTSVQEYLKSEIVEYFSDEEMLEFFGILPTENVRDFIQQNRIKDEPFRCSSGNNREMASGCWLCPVLAYLFEPSADWKVNSFE